MYFSTLSIEVSLHNYVGLNCWIGCRSCPKSLIDIEGSTLICHVLRQLYRPGTAMLVSMQPWPFFEPLLAPGVAFSTSFSSSLTMACGSGQLRSSSKLFSGPLIIEELERCARRMRGLHLEAWARGSEGDGPQVVDLREDYSGATVQASL